MRRLIATATAVGVASISCGKEKVPTDPSGERNGCGKKSGTTSGGGDPNASSGGTSGYAVVDPMPPPAHCPDVAPNVAATAKFIASDGGILSLHVHFPPPTARADYKYVKDAQPVAYAGKVVSSEHKADGLHVIVTPDASATNVSVSVKGTCDKGPGTLSANVSWTGAPKPGTAGVVFVTEY